MCTKVCKTCEVERPTEEFAQRRAVCKECHNKSRRDARAQKKSASPVAAITLLNAAIERARVAAATAVVGENLSLADEYAQRYSVFLANLQRSVPGDSRETVSPQPSPPKETIIEKKSGVSFVLTAADPEEESKEEPADDEEEEEEEESDDPTDG